MTSRIDRLRCATSHNLDSERFDIIKKRVRAPKDKSPQKLIIQELILSFLLPRLMECDRCNSVRKIEFSNERCFSTRTKAPPKRWLKTENWNELLKLGTNFSVWFVPPCNTHHRKELFFLKLGSTPSTPEIIQPETRCAPISSSSTSCSFDQGPYQRFPPSTICFCFTAMKRLLVARASKVVVLRVVF